jgi:hypothetical protein
MRQVDQATGEDLGSQRRPQEQQPAPAGAAAK